MSVHLIKLVVGIDDLATLANWQNHAAITYQGKKASFVRTRYKPRRADEILEHSGSIYRVIKGRILCRQRILGFEQEEDAVKGKQCFIIIDNQIIRTEPMPYKPFQGWRYMEQERVPKDVGPYDTGGNDGANSFEEGLKELGVL